MILMESVGNALRHGRATFVSVKIAFDETGLTMTVADNGRGFDTEAARLEAESGLHLGLANMRRRAERIGGELSVESSPYEGATVTVRVPYEGRCE